MFSALSSSRIDFVHTLSLSIPVCSGSRALKKGRRFEVSSVYFEVDIYKKPTKEEEREGRAANFIHG